MPKITPADDELMHSVIQRVATGPELSKNISREEAQAVMAALLDGSADPVQAAVFLIGLRMKRETHDEMKGVLDAILCDMPTIDSACTDVVVMADPYNGFNRTLQASLTVLPVLAACGVPAYSTGVRSMGPKFGVTHHTIIQALGGNPLQSVETIAEQLNTVHVGWGYIDQSVFCPRLHALETLRRKIVKRPVLSTLDVMLAPIRGGSHTHLVTGFVHKPYPPIYSMLARECGYASILLVRGTEGGVIPSFRSKGKVVRYRDQGADTETDIFPADMGLERSYRAADLPTETPAANSGSPIGQKWAIDAVSKTCAEATLTALNNTPGPALDAAVMGAALTLWHLGRSPTLAIAADHARQVIASGDALARLQKGLV